MISIGDVDWLRPETWGQPAASDLAVSGSLLPPKQTAPTFSLALASATGFANTSLAATRAALASGRPVFRAGLSDGAAGAGTAGTPAASPPMRERSSYERVEAPSEGPPVALIAVGGVVLAGLAFLALRKR